MRYQIPLLSIEYITLSLLLGLILIPLLSPSFWSMLRNTALALLHLTRLFQSKAPRLDEAPKQAETMPQPIRRSSQTSGAHRTAPKARYESKAGIRSAEWYGTRARPVRRRHK
ncbi:hypothetical protein AB4Y96_05540 [Phyllobacterium sp. TAF24]|uniref:hypothetical protein n=1 Tax=Phyllobacterium sp. TAF24 TaxID=3233068 RepID=UPI003F999F06